MYFCKSELKFRRGKRTRTDISEKSCFPRSREDRGEDGSYFTSQSGCSWLVGEEKKRGAFKLSCGVAAGGPALPARLLRLPLGCQPARPRPAPCSQSFCDRTRQALPAGTSSLRIRRPSADQLRALPPQPSSSSSLFWENIPRLAVAVGCQAG